MPTPESQGMGRRTRNKSGGGQQRGTSKQQGAEAQEGKQTKASELPAHGSVADRQAVGHGGDRRDLAGKVGSMFTGRWD